MQLPAKCAVPLLLCLLAVPASALPPPWVPLGPFGGSIRSLTADPKSSGTVYATAFPGIFKTVDGGASWAASTLEQPTTAVAVDPIHPSTLYVGVQGLHLLLKSIDGGASWTPSGSGLPGSPFAFPASLAVDPSDPRRLLLAYDNKVWRSADAGAFWQPAANGLPISFGGGAQTVAFAARPAGTAFAATGAGLYRTADAGLSWKRMDHGLPVAPVSLLALAPSDPRTVYVYLPGLGLYRTADGGATWRQAAGPSGLFGLALAVSPDSPRTLYTSLSGAALFRSTDGGAHWSSLSGVSGVTALAFDAGSPRRIYAGALALPLGGVWRSDDGGASWARRSQGMTGLAAFLAAVDPGNPDRLWTTVGAALFRSDNGGTRWARATSPSPFPLGSLAVGASSDVFAGVPFQIPRGPLVYSTFKTADGGASWKSVLDAIQFDVLQIRTAPSEPSTIYAAGLDLVSEGNRLFRSTDNGDTWELRSSGALLPSCSVEDVTAAPSAAAVLYLWGYDRNPATSLCARSLLRSEDGGATWTNITAGLPVVALLVPAVDPHDPNTVYVGTIEGVWKSTDGGRAWALAGNELVRQPITRMITASIPGRLYAVVDGTRVLRSDDGGATWQDWSRELRTSGIYFLVADPGDPGRIYAATANGVWKLTETD